MTTPSSTPHLLGRGRSAWVWAQRDLLGREVACKVFTPDLASRLVFHVLDGAKNPYAWCEDAVGAALERRALLARLVPLWFDGRVRLPRTDGARWNAQARTFELVMERIRGGHVPLGGPFDMSGTDPLKELTGEILPRLQAHLRDAGFEGLLWQAGYGNPVACANFLLEARPGEAAPQRAKPGPRWVWIDLESGVPALFAADPRVQVGFYLRRALELHRPLFDDVDVARLESYLETQRAGLESRLDPGTTDQLLAIAGRLDERQRRWRSLGRLERGVRAALLGGSITREQAERFRRRPGAWGRHLAWRGARRGLEAIASGVTGVARRLARVRWGRLLHGLGRLLCSQRYRDLLGRRFAHGRVRAWQRRGFLTNAQAGELRRGMHATESSAYVADFVMHFMLKPVAKILQYVVAPLLILLGIVGPGGGVVLVLGGGAVVRTLYTLGRLVQALLRRRPAPWVALGVGALPWVGTLAYAVQLVVSGLSQRDPSARFLLHDAMATLARNVPVWGGPDTALEHWASRLPLRLERRGVAPGPASVPIPHPPPAAAPRVRQGAATSEEIRS